MIMYETSACKVRLQVILTSTLPHKQHVFLAIGLNILIWVFQTLKWCNAKINKYIQGK